MEKLQAIVSLRAAGYNQSVLKTWFSEPVGWMESRVMQHQAIRDDLMKKLVSAGLKVRKPEAGSYLFIKMPPLDVSIGDFCKILRVHAGVTVTPGTEFGSGFCDCFRINFSQDHKAACDAIDRVITMIERYVK